MHTFSPLTVVARLRLPPIVNPSVTLNSFVDETCLEQLKHTLMNCSKKKITYKLKLDVNS